jgi:hypothetical protein
MRTSWIESLAYKGECYYQLVLTKTSGEATGGLGGFEPLLASWTTPGVRTKPQIKFFWEEVGIP